MSTVFMMRFNDRQAGVIADESTWHLSFKYGYRRSNYGDHVLPLLDEKRTERTGCAAVYAGVGFPCFHFEVVEHARKILSSAGEPQFSDVEDVSELVYREYQKAHGRMVDDLVRFLSGFDRDEMNALSFHRDGRDFEIRQEAVLQEAKKIVSYQNKSDHMRRIFDNEAAVVGYSPRHGIQGFLMTPHNKEMEFAYSLFVLGAGSQIASHVFGEIAATMDLDKRRKGFSMREGLADLLTIAVNTRTFQSRMGGYFQLLLVDGEAGEPRKILTEIADHRVKLASEIACAFSWEFLEKSAAERLMSAVLLEGMQLDEAEQEMFSASADSALLRRCLTGYKPPHCRFTRKKILEGEPHDIHQCH